MNSSEFWDCDYGCERDVAPAFGIKLPNGKILPLRNREERDELLDAIRESIKNAKSV